MAWYRAGTVSVTNGSAVVTGANTDFVSNTQQGEAFLGPDGRVYEVAQVISATQLTLGGNYQGASAGGQGYALMPTSSFARDLALGAAQLLNTFATVRDGIGAGLFPDGSEAAPAFRFTADQDTGIARGGSNILMILSGGARRFTVDGDGAFVSGSRMDIRGVGSSRITHSTNVANYSSGVPDGVNRWCVTENQFGNEALSVVGANIGIGTITPASRLHLASTNATQLNIESTSGGGDTGIAYRVPGKQWNVGINIGASGAGSFNMFDVSRGAAVVTLDSGGNFLAGVTSGTEHTLVKNLGQGAAIMRVFGAGGAGASSMAVASVSGYSPNGAGSAIYVGQNTSTGRSINAGGTINASGADYAEYMRKAEGCGTIAKGDVCGVDRNGFLTRTWASAVSYVVKSTDPSLVGGDVWAGHLGPKPEPIDPEPTAPGEAPALPETDEGEALTAWREAVAAHNVLVAAYPAAHSQWVSDQAAYETALAAWEADLETARQCVDRIAFCGQVPVNITGDFAVGDYVIAVANGSGIKAIAVAEADITFDQYRRRIGKIWAVRDGRAWVDVQHG